MYSVKEIFYTIQGEGAQSGRAAVFCRFAGCNLWSGREADRLSADCQFCDTDFVGTNGVNGGKYVSHKALVDAVEGQWPSRSRTRRYVVCTGGEPLLQLDHNLIEEFHNRGFEVAVETNGTIPVPATIDWICVSPKGSSNVVQITGHELKLVYPQRQAMPEQFIDFEFEHYYLQPLDKSYIATSNDDDNYVQQTVDYCLRHPQWRLSLQTHKITGIR